MRESASVRAKARRRLRHEPRVGGDREPDRRRPVGQDDRALEDHQPRLGWAGAEIMAVDLAVGEGVGRQGQDLVPERARAQPLTAGAVDLPVEAGERPPEARVAELPDQPQRAVGGRRLKQRRELVEVGLELGLYPALDVLAEEVGQDHVGRDQRAGDPHQRSGEEPEAQRAGGGGGPQGSSSR